MCEPEWELMSLYGAELANHLSAHHNTVSSDVRYGRILFFFFVILDCINILKPFQNANSEIVF